MTKIIFLGSDKYSDIVLDTLRQDSRIEIIKVIKNGQELENLANELKFNPPDVAIVASFGHFIPSQLLNFPKRGFLNIHPSLLPKYRGSSPAQFAILNAEKETGATIFKLGEKIDHGPILAQIREPIRADDTSQSLYERLFAIGAKKLIEILPDYLTDKIGLAPQDNNKATYTKKLTREDGFVSIEKILQAISPVNSSTIPGAPSGHLEGVPLTRCTAAQLDRFIRAMHFWPGAWSEIRIRRDGDTTKRLKILRAHLETRTIPDRLKPTIRDRQRQVLVLDQVQMEGKKPVSFKQFCEGYPQAEIIA